VALSFCAQSSERTDDRMLSTRLSPSLTPREFISIHASMECEKGGISEPTMPASCASSLSCCSVGNLGISDAVFLNDADGSQTSEALTESGTEPEVCIGSALFDGVTALNSGWSVGLFRRRFLNLLPAVGLTVAGCAYVRDRKLNETDDLDGNMLNSSSEEVCRRVYVSLTACLPWSDCPSNSLDTVRAIDKGVAAAS
jgi:hypothetical protein